MLGVDEEPIKIIDEEIVKVREVETNSGVDSSKLIKDLEKKKTQTIKSIFNELSPWQRVQLSRHPDRPYSLDYINAITDGNFICSFSLYSRYYDIGCWLNLR